MFALWPWEIIWRPHLPAIEAETPQNICCWMSQPTTMRKNRIAIMDYQWRALVFSSRGAIRLDGIFAELAPGLPLIHSRFVFGPAKTCELRQAG
jgi:hypothetical protein